MRWCASISDARPVGSESRDWERQAALSTRLGRSPTLTTCFPFHAEVPAHFSTALFFVRHATTQPMREETIATGLLLAVQRTSRTLMASYAYIARLTTRCSEPGHRALVAICRPAGRVAEEFKLKSMNFTPARKLET